MIVNTSKRGIDYGPRKGTEGLSVHMSEGGDGLVDYLARHRGEGDAVWSKRVRGVSCNFAILSTGAIWQMVGWANASGSMNPADRGPKSGFYNAGILRAVLGDHYTDPNAYSLSVELAGYRSKGPTKAQVDSLVWIVGEARRRYPKLRGVYGHADQTTTKGCPGTAPTMLDFWNRVGHGLFLPDTSTEDPVEDIYSVPGRKSAVWPAGTPIYKSGTGGTSTSKTGVERRYELVGQNVKAPGKPTRYFVDGAGDEDGGAMRYLPADKMTGLRDDAATDFARGRDAAVKAAQAVRP